jgi:hypothetical protein
MAVISGFCDVAGDPDLDGPYFCSGKEPAGVAKRQGLDGGDHERLSPVGYTLNEFRFVSIPLQSANSARFNVS